MPVLYSRFPARVVTSDGSEINRCAVVAIDGRAELAVTRPGQDPGGAASVQVIATLDDPALGDPGRTATLTGSDGQTWTISDGDGCGCRSPLQSWYAQRIAGQPAGT